ncbi:hypothetical protein D6D20_07759 [Aureobasidium pullulans]|uniref:F-box domain-containing protein n=1 Tax=Aureobasidium pullulans TaxID=5580 RepID=A0A4S8YS04_AURPU|nr:hypothetical protein D6D20_07759 [Aureobasidium pullulans]
MSSTSQLTGPSASTVAMSARQEFTPEQLERIKSVVNCLVTSSGLERTPGSAVADFLHTQDLMSCRTGPITPVKQSPPISFLDLPAEVRNKIYRHCLVVGSVFPRRKAGDSRTESFRQHEMPQTQLFLVCRQIFHESAPMYFGLNKFVISYGPASEWPWSDPLRLWKSSISRFAYENMKSMSIPFDLRDHRMQIPEVIRHRHTKNSVKHQLSESWKARFEKMALFNLDLLEMSFVDCCSLRSGQRLIKRALHHLLHEVDSVPKLMVLEGFISKDEVDEIRTHIEEKYLIELDDEDPENPWRIVIDWS